MWLLSSGHAIAEMRSLLESKESASWSWFSMWFESSSGFWFLMTVEMSVRER